MRTIRIIRGSCRICQTGSPVIEITEHPFHCLAHLIPEGFQNSRTFQGDPMGQHQLLKSLFLSALLGFGFLSPSGKAFGQTAPELRLDARSPEGFGFLGAIRPMSDGKILVADPLGDVLVLVDLDAERADTLGRVGGGPQEYRQPDGVFPLPGDSTLIVDLGNGRLIVMAPDGTFTRTMPIAQQNASGHLTISIPRFVDREGHLYLQPEDIAGGPLPDSARIVRFDLATGQVDTVAMVGLAEPAQQSSRSRVTLGRAPLGPMDDWAVAADGAVAVVRADGYAVQWLRPTSPSVVGPDNVYRRLPVGRAEKEAWIESFFSASISMGIQRSADGSRRVSLSRGSSGGGTLDAGEYPWPDNLPPFRAGRSMVSEEGDLWVERYGRVGSPVTMDLFDRLGKKRGEVELPLDRRVGGFGSGVVYLIHTDVLGLQWLERYRWAER
jgi:hypothetical protein